MWNLLKRPRAGRMAWVAMFSATMGAGLHADPADDYQKGMQTFNSGDLVGAMQYLERAADAGHVEAQLRYAYIQDQAEENAVALRYYRLAADAGSHEAAYSLGTMYASGDGVGRDHVQAVRWYERAAEGGYNEALETLGIAYQEGGLGLLPDSERGRQLLQRAADNGHEPARRLLEKKVRQSGK